jgi:peptidoglycan/LPS O-acetylase OafA/YrhL
VHAMHLLWDRLGLSAHSSDAFFFFVTLAPMPLLAITIYLYFEKPVTKTLQAPLRTRFGALRPLSVGPTSPASFPTRPDTIFGKEIRQT